MGVGIVEGGMCGCGYSRGRYVCGLFCTLRLLAKAKFCGTCMSGVCVELDEEWYHKIRTIAIHKYMYAGTPFHILSLVYMCMTHFPLPLPSDQQESTYSNQLPSLG